MLKHLAKRRPIDLATISTVDGMSEKKVADYGADIIKVRGRSRPACSFVRFIPIGDTCASGRRMSLSKKAAFVLGHCQSFEHQRTIAGAD